MNADALEKTLRHFVANIDSYTHAYLAGDGGRGTDRYPALTKAFIESYEESLEELDERAA